MDSKETKMALAEAAIGYVFRDRDILWEALQAAGNGVTRSGLRPVTAGNKLLAKIGDPIIKVLLNKQSYEDGFDRGKISPNGRKDFALIVGQEK